jgi:signal transduction histidine kinase
MSSLQGRLSLGLLGSLVLLFVLQWLAASVFLRNIAEDQTLSRLEQDAEGLLAALIAASGEAPSLDAKRVAPSYLRPFSGHYYVILTRAGTWSSRSLWDESLPIQPLEPGAVAVSRAPGPEQQRLLVRSGGYSKQDEPVTIAVAEDLSTFDRSLLRFQIGYAVISAAALLALFLAQRWILHASLEPLERVRKEMARLEEGEIQSVSTRVPAEVAPLVAELNRLLVALRERGRRSRQALGNLAHALRTQLALLTQSLEDPRVRDDPRLRAELSAPLQRMQALTERELKRARLAGAALPGQRVDIGAELDRLCVALRAIHADKPLKIEMRIPPGALFKGDGEDFLELMGNLLDNAAKFCLGTVRMTVQTQPQLQLKVEDDGPGCVDEQLEELTGRGVRADESVPGAGLGLAIARDIAESYGGRLRLGRSPDLGGFLAEVRLPTGG